MDWDRTLANIIHEMSPPYAGRVECQLAHLTMSENIQSCEAQSAASEAFMGELAQNESMNAFVRHIHRNPDCAPSAVLAATADRLMEVTSGREIPQEHPTSPDTPKGLLRVATDGERCNGRLAWVPGARG